MNALSLLFDRYADLRPEGACWLDFEDGGDGNNHCSRCIKKLDPEGKHYTQDTGSRESDRCVHCGTCGKLLDYTLTDSGADSELEHFRHVRFRRDKQLDRDTAYHLARLLDAKGNDCEAIMIAARAIRCMKSIPNLET